MIGIRKPKKSLKRKISTPGKNKTFVCERKHNHIILGGLSLNNIYLVKIKCFSGLIKVI